MTKIPYGFKQVHSIKDWDGITNLWFSTNGLIPTTLQWASRVHQSTRVALTPGFTYIQRGSRCASEDPNHPEQVTIPLVPKGYEIILGTHEVPEDTEVWYDFIDPSHNKKGVREWLRTETPWYVYPRSRDMVYIWRVDKSVSGDPNHPYNLPYEYRIICNTLEVNLGDEVEYRGNVFLVQRFHSKEIAVVVGVTGSSRMLINTKYLKKL